MMTGKFEITKDRAGRFRWRLKASNGEIILTGQSYESKEGTKRGIESVKSNTPKAPVEDRILEIDLSSVKEGTPRTFPSGSSVYPEFLVSEKEGKFSIYPIRKKQ